MNHTADPDTEELHRRVAHNIRQHRRRLGLTQQQLADQLRIKRSCIGSYEECRAQPPLITVLRLCRLFGVRCEDFLTQTTTP